MSAPVIPVDAAARYELVRTVEDIIASGERAVSRRAKTPDDLERARAAALWLLARARELRT